MQEPALTAQQMAAVLEDLPLAVLVCALDSRQLLYANEPARALIARQSAGRGTACHWAFGYDTPCPSCPAAPLAGSSPTACTGDIFNSGPASRISGKLVEWDGQRAYMEYIRCSDRCEGSVEALTASPAQADPSQAQLERDHLIHAIPGGVARYRVQGGRFLPTFYTDGVLALSGHTREEFDALVGDNALNLVYEPDRARVLAKAQSALAHGNVLDISYRMRHRDGNLIWIHLNGRRMGPRSEVMQFYAVFTGMSAETRLFQSIANETADGIYVIDKETYELLYANEPRRLFSSDSRRTGRKCYEALYGKSAPCTFCSLNSHLPDGAEHPMVIDGSDRFYTTRFRLTDWNGIPAYIKFIRDVTDQIHAHREKERLAMYFQTVVKNLPGGIAVIRCEPDGRMTPEFISDGFAAITHMSLEELETLYAQSIFAGVHPDDIPENEEKLRRYMEHGEGNCELTVRMRRGNGGYVWVKDRLTMLQTTDGVRRLYSIYTDVSETVEQQEQLRRQYEDIILQHYYTPGPDDLILGHCNITQNVILEIIDHTNSDLLSTFGWVREEFFTGIAGLVVDETERQTFLDTYLNAPALEAFQRQETEVCLKCFIQLPHQAHGTYVLFKVNLVETPDTGDITGILTVTNITEQTISDRILHQLSVTSYDYVVDLDLIRDCYAVLVCNQNAHCAPPPQGSHSGRVAEMVQTIIVPRDRQAYANALDRDEIRRRLETEGSYVISYSITDETGEIRTKNTMVSAVDLQLGRVCLVCTDITDSVREQQGLLNMIAYTFELAGFIDVGGGRFTMYTRKMVLENLSPYVVDHYSDAVIDFTSRYAKGEDQETVQNQFRIQTMLQHLEEKPGGYDFVFSHQSEAGLRYKQVNVLWGDENHTTICVVRADVTDMLAAERQAKKGLEDALALAEEANRAKSDFLSAMSHDIRTPMNAIMGMTKLAVAHLDHPERVADCLQKIAISSKHLLSLINDVLDMSKIERSQITMNRMNLSLPSLMEQLSAMMAPQARVAGLRFQLQSRNIRHPYFYGDSLRINQILINLLSNALKFTPEGGAVDCLAEEVPAQGGGNRVRYRFIISDTGMGMSEEFRTQIFAPFARSRAAARIEGTGLGLSITKGLVDQMGGEISVESRMGEGSTFQVELEFEAAQEDEEARASAAGMQWPAAAGETVFSGCRFLVVEDNPINAEILCELLAMDGASTVLKTDGAQAVQAFLDAAPGTYDAILMDIQMPEMSGYEATRAIRALTRRDAKSIPIVAMTANAFAEDIQAAQDAGMNAHVAKPIDMDILRNTLYTLPGIIKPAQ